MKGERLSAGRDRGRRLPCRRRAAQPRDRGQPRDGAVLRQLAVRLGRADRSRARRALRRLLGRRHHRRPAGRRRSLFVGVLGLAAVLVLAIPFVDEWMLEQVVAWNPGPRMNPLVATVALFGLPSVVLGTVSPIAVKLLRPLARAPRADRRQALRRLDRRLDRGHVRDRVLPHPRARHRSADRDARGRAAAGRGRGGDRRAPRPRHGRHACRRRRELRGASSRSRPTRAGSSPPRSSRTGRPLYRQRAAEDRSGGPAEGQEGYELRLRQGQPLPPDRRRRRRGQPLPPLRQLLPERHVPGRSLQDPLRVLRLPPPRAGLQARRAQRALHRPRRRLGAEAHVARLPRGAVRRSRARPRRGRRRLPLLRAAAERAAERRGRGRPALPRADERPWDAIVVDAFYSDSIPFHLATNEFLELARSRLAPGGVVVTNIIGATRGERVTAAALDAAHLPHGLPDGGRASGARRGRHEPERRPQRHLRRRRGSGAVEGVPDGALERPPRAAPPAPRPDARDPRSARRARSPRATSPCSRTTTRRPTRCCSSSARRPHPAWIASPRGCRR